MFVGTRLSFVLRVFCLWVAVGSLGLEACLADVLILKNGRILERDKMKRVKSGVRVYFKHGRVTVPEDSIQTYISDTAGGFVPKTAEEKEKFEKGLVPFEGKWMKPERRKKLVRRRIREKRDYVEDVRAHQMWKDRYQKKTKHFLFEYTVPPHIADYYASLMDVYFVHFAKQWKTKRPRTHYPLKVCFYTDYEEFGQVSGAGFGVLGYFRFVQPIEINFYYNSLDARDTEEVLFHELNHYLQQLINVKFSMPHFPGESLAEYYGASTYDPKTKKVTVGLIQEGRLSSVKTDIAAGDVMSLEKLVSTDRMYEHYNWGWTLVHFMMKKKEHRKRFMAFVNALAHDKNVRRVPIPFDGLTTVEGSEVWRVFQRYLGLEDKEKAKDFEDAWIGYVKENLNITSTRGKEKAARDARRTDRPIRAKRLYREAIEQGSTNPLAYHEYAELLSRDNKRKEAVRMWRKAIKLDPLTARYYEALGNELLGDDSKKNRKLGRRLLGLSLELDPENVWLEKRVKLLLEK